MPDIQITDITGRGYRITSSDNETIARWLVEILSQLTTPNTAYNQINIRIYPLWVGPDQGGAWDWHPGANYTFVEELREATPYRNIRELSDKMLAYAQKAERM
jgi:hypothetical protein